MEKEGSMCHRHPEYITESFKYGKYYVIWDKDDSKVHIKRLKRKQLRSKSMFRMSKGCTFVWKEKEPDNYKFLGEELFVGDIVYIADGDKDYELIRSIFIEDPTPYPIEVLHDLINKSLRRKM